METEKIEYDVVIIGGGPSGFATAIHLLDLASQNKISLKICMLDKGSNIGAHIISGAILEPGPFHKLLPDDWQSFNNVQKVTKEEFWLLTNNKKIKLPIPSTLKNSDNLIISLEELCQFLSKIAQSKGLEIYSGFAANEFIKDSDKIIGIKTGELGLDKNKKPKINYQAGISIYAKKIVLAEGCRGQLTQQVINDYNLKNSSPQTYGLGIKEIWQIPKAQHHPGFIVHSLGWPLDHKTYGGGFMYHYNENLVSVGMIIGLDYQNPWLDPYEELQKYKTHPEIIKILNGGSRVSYGARAVTEGGYQTIPKLEFPGGIIVGDAAGFLNTAKIKGIHNAINSGMIAAEGLIDFFKSNLDNKYQELFNKSDLCCELKKIRNIRPGFKYGLFLGLINASFELYISQGKSPWTFKTNDDYKSLKLSKYSKKIIYPPHDGNITFDKLTSLAYSNVSHEHNQPAHLILKNPDLAIDYNYKLYNSPEIRYCPAGVYEISTQNNDIKLNINSQNCIHCKTCDIKDPRQNILWTSPEGGGGPNYQGM